MLLLATSCLQGQPLARACLALLRLRPDGLQLCPGHPPSLGWRGVLERVSDLALRTHHGFDWGAYRRPVWGEGGRYLLDPPAPGDPQRSVHAPQQIPGSLGDWLSEQAAAGRVLETPHAGALGRGDALELAMSLGVALAVDVAHLAILRAKGALGDRALARLLDYDRVAEVHASTSDGRYDLHRPVGPDSFGLDWVRARRDAGTPVILECYMHKLSEDDRRRQVEALR